MDRRTDGQTDRRTNGQKYYNYIFLFLNYPLKGLKIYTYSNSHYPILVLCTGRIRLPGYHHRVGLVVVDASKVPDGQGSQRDIAGGWPRGDLAGDRFHDHIEGFARFGNVTEIKKSHRLVAARHC